MLLKLAKRRRKIAVVPEFELQSEKSRKRDRTATADEYSTLLGKMERHYQRPLIGLYETAMRIREVLKLDGIAWTRRKVLSGSAVFAEQRAELKQAKVVTLSRGPSLHSI